MKEPGVCAICAGGIENSTATECICPEGFLTYAEEICISCNGPTSSMSLMGSCMCDDESALFNEETSSCVCRAYYLEAKLSSKCISCFGDGAYLNDLDECQCKNGSQLYQGGLCDFPEIPREPIIFETSQEMTTAAAPLKSDVSLIIIPWILLLLLLLILLQFCWLYCKRNIVTKIPIEDNIANEPELDELITPKSAAAVERPPRRVSTPVVIPPTPEPRNQFSTAGTSTDVEYKPVSRDQEMQTSTRSLASISSQQSSSSSWTMENTPVVPHSVNELAQQRSREPISPPQVAVNIVGANDGIVNWDYQRDVAYYIVSCIKLFDQDKDERMFKLSPEETQTLIPALHPDSEVVTKGSPPGPPQRITFDNIDDQSVHVSWGDPPDVDTRITKYLLMYYPSNNQAKKQVLPLPGNQRTIAISKLQKSEEYIFEIRAETRWGLGDVQTSTVTIDQMKNSDRNSIFFAESISDLTRHISSEQLNEKAHQQTTTEHRQKAKSSISGKDLSILAQAQVDSSSHTSNQTVSKSIAKVTLTTETMIGRVAQNSFQHNNQSIEEAQVYRKLEIDGDEDILRALGPQAVDIMNNKYAEGQNEEVLVPVEVDSSYELDSEITDVLRVQLRNQYQPLYDDTEAYPSSIDDEPVSTLSSEQASHFQQLAGRYQSEADESGSFHFENLIHSEAAERQSLLLEERMDSRIRQSSNSSELQESANQSQLSVATCIETGEVQRQSTTSAQKLRSQADLDTVYRSNAISTSASVEQKTTFRKSTTEVYDSFKQQQKLNIYDNIASANIMESIGSISVQSDDKEKDEDTHWTYSL
ncbi:unnamed protein product [Oikopleura dioica]|uniref:Fibronectin type-III domain-containing protein n=1 Tax=Oikopleura dioica TaxID=34765 RepID=E4YLU3_OIKDI|nr:unnamed protein product [Oikopleura dioica]